jgi:hypothetical protein
LPLHRLQLGDQDGGPNEAIFERGRKAHELRNELLKGSEQA